MNSMRYFTIVSEKLIDIYRIRILMLKTSTDADVSVICLLKSWKRNTFI